MVGDRDTSSAVLVAVDVCVCSKGGQARGMLVQICTVQLITTEGRAYI